MCAVNEVQNEFKVWVMSDNRRSRRNMLQILASPDCPAPFATLACMKGMDIAARAACTLYSAELDMKLNPVNLSLLPIVSGGAS